MSLGRINLLNHKSTATLIFGVMFLFYVMLYHVPLPFNTDMEAWYACIYNKEDENATDVFSARLVDVEKTDIQENSIFFHETACIDDLNARQACSVESTARYNKKKQIYVLMTSPKVNLGPEGGEYIEMLSSTFPNVHIHRINITSYAANTVLEKWVEGGDIMKSRPDFRISHLSDALRYLTLCKYGGTYIDLDFVMIHSLEGRTNFTAEESESVLSAGIINFEKNHPLAEACLLEFREGYDGGDWGHNGPKVLQRVLGKLCDHQEGSEVWNNCAGGFEVYPPEMFYPIKYEDWKKPFEEKMNHDTMKLVETSIGVHFWNKRSFSEKIRVGSRQPYALIAERHCPMTYRMSGNYF